MDVSAPSTVLIDSGLAREGTARPVAKADRIQTIDIVRGFALLGILMMNIPYFGLSYTAIPRFFTAPANSPDFRTLAVVSVVFEGTMRALFSMLFGAGMLLFMAKKDNLADGYGMPDYYYRRLFWLILFGVFNAYILLWPGDILYTYGVCGLFLFPFRKMPPRNYLLIAFFCVAVSGAKGFFGAMETKEKREGYKQAIQLEKQKKPLTDEQKKAKEAWLTFEKNFKYDKKKEEEVNKTMLGSYGTVFTYLIPLNTKLESTKFYLSYIWDAWSLMFLGMALFKWGFFSNKLSTRTYFLTLLAGYGFGLTFGWFGFRDHVAWYTDPGKAFDSDSFPFQAFYHVRRAASAIGHASLLLLIYRSGVVSWLMKALANVGQMAFTNYLMQSIICTLFFYGYGFSYFGKLSYYELYFVVAAVWVFQLIFSAIWLQFFRFGPFEWLWRSLTYWKRQPMKLN
ncbi:DUF418 domain-containing protein [Larkinella terrae]|uniref:DUF418 domain-containing protein n=1 Tax=Larkinella terrae TaxID=2025311 RepID=A0A7K0EVG0_9BACT|nr:DUF418 domain-containing protein [Larkinella terrae]MRS65815.1 DUF418 domain-containing protein [Larkinella terrae]